MYMLTVQTKSNTETGIEGQITHVVGVQSSPKLNSRKI